MTDAADPTELRLQNIANFIDERLRQAAVGAVPQDFGDGFIEHGRQTPAQRYANGAMVETRDSRYEDDGQPDSYARILRMKRHMRETSLIINENQEALAYTR